MDYMKNIYSRALNSDGQAQLDCFGKSKLNVRFWRMVTLQSEPKIVRQ